MPKYAYLKIIAASIVRSAAVFIIFLVTALFIRGLIGCDCGEPFTFKGIEMYPTCGCPDQVYFTQSAAPIVMLSPLLAFVLSLAIGIADIRHRRANRQLQAPNVRSSKRQRAVRFVLITALIAWVLTIGTSWISRENLEPVVQQRSPSGFITPGGCDPLDGTVDYGLPFAVRTAEWGCIRPEHAQIIWGGLLLNYLVYLGVSGCLIAVAVALHNRRRLVK